MKGMNVWDYTEAMGINSSRGFRTSEMKNKIRKNNKKQKKKNK